MSRNKPDYDNFFKNPIIPIPDSETGQLLKRHDFKTFSVLNVALTRIKDETTDHIEDMLHEKVRNGTIKTEGEALHFLNGAMAVLTSLTGDSNLVPPVWLINAMSGRSAVESDPELEKKLAGLKSSVTVTRKELTDMVRGQVDGSGRFTIYPEGDLTFVIESFVDELEDLYRGDYGAEILDDDVFADRLDNLMDGELERSGQ